MATAFAAQLKGLTAAPGKARGSAIVIRGACAAGSGRTIGESEVASEVERFHTAVARAVSELKVLESDVLQRLGAEKAAIFSAQQMMAEDPTLEESVKEQIERNLVSAEEACVLACEQHAQALLDLNDPYLSERAADLRDIGRRLIRCLPDAPDAPGESRAPGTPSTARPGAPASLSPGTVLVAVDLAPSDTAGLDTSKVVAVVLDSGGVTSHTAILARSLGIPAVVATQSATSVIMDSDTVLVDADAGLVHVNPDQNLISEFNKSVATAHQERQRLEALRDLPGVTRDGHRVEIAANIGEPGEVQAVRRAGGEGVGLFRTEFLFLNRQTAPTEEEQYEAYRTVLQGLDPMPVVIRTLDIGGDKSVPYLNLAPEENPFLGLRAIRLCLVKRDLFRVQIRALLRASVHGNLKIMFPMISNLVELREARAELNAVKHELLAEGTQVSESIQVGIMVEVPSAAIDADILARECDFFSIGTNDLVQYTLAADRGNPAVANLSTPFHPAVLRLIARTIEEGHKGGIWVGMCGEMAGNPVAVTLLVGMGIDELSMAIGSISRAKSIVRSVSLSDASRVWQHVKRLSSQHEVATYLQGLEISTKPPV